MPNITLTYKFPKSEINKSNIMKKAWIYIREGFSKKEAFKKSWQEATRLEVKFWSNAKPEDIAWVIKSCQKDGKVNTDLLRKWDNYQIQHPLDWVSYNLRRNGFFIEKDFKNVYNVSFEVPKL